MTTQPNQYAEIMSSKTDEQLLIILTRDKDDYNEEAIEAAKGEFDNRDLDDTDLKYVQERVDLQTKEQEKRASEPLSDPGRILFFVFCWTLVPYLVAASYKADGLEEKYQKAMRAMRRGWLTILILFVLSIVISVILDGA